MRLSLAISLLLTPIAAAEPAFPPAAPGSPGVPAADLDALADVVAGFVKADQIIGAELLVIKNGRTILHKGFGLKDMDAKTPMPTDTIFCVRSMTKPTIGVAVQMLVDEGKLALDDPIAKYLPAFDTDKSRGITVKHLLTHTGGLKLSTILGTGFKAFSGVRDLADRVGKNGPESPPGSRYNYSDDGADTLTALVGVVSGKPAEQFLKERLFDPLGMSDTIPVLKADDPKIQRVASGHAGSKGAWIKFWAAGETPVFPFFLGSQGLYSTPADYARFLKMIADGGTWGDKRLLSKEAVARILAPAPDRAATPTGFDDRRSSYGQFMQLYLDPAGKVQAFGHSGSDGTHAYAFPDRDLFVFYFTQSRGNTTFLEFETALHRLLVEPGKKGLAAEPPVDAKAVAPFLGLYWFEPVKCPVSVEVRDGRLWLDLPFQAELDLKPADKPTKWTARLNPAIGIEFQQTGADPAAAVVLTQGAARFEMARIKPADDLPTAAAVAKLRADKQGTADLSKLGVVRIKGTVERQVASKPTTSEVLFDGLARYRIESVTDGAKELKTVDGDAVWSASTDRSPRASTGTLIDQSRIDHPAFAAAVWDKLFAETRVLRRYESDKKSLLVLWAVSKQLPPRVLTVEEATGRLVSGYHIEIVPGVGRIGKRVQYADYKDVNGVWMPTRVTHLYQTPLLGRVEVKYTTIEAGVTAPPGAFTLKPGK